MSNNPVKTENIVKFLRYKYMFCLQISQFGRYFKPFYFVILVCLTDKCKTAKDYGKSFF